MIVLKNGAELQKMRAAGRIVAEILTQIESMVVPGVTTADLDQFAERECRRHGAKPAFKGYGGFPFVICARLNKKEKMLTAFERRLRNSRAQEIEAALAEIAKIAWLRLQEILPPS